MRLRRVPGSREVVAASPLVLQEAEALACCGKWQALFPVPRPLVLEIGMGKGRFITEAAAADSERNFLGLELHEELVAMALKKLAAPLENLRFLQLNADRLSELFAKGEVSRIYLHFPDPWPKARHEKRRLTAPGYLSMYREILAADGDLIFKTDNAALFEWSLPNFSAAGFRILCQSRDLPQCDAGIITEYESRYRNLAQPIFYLHVGKRA